MSYEQLKRQWLAEEQVAFSGWDFSHIKDRWKGEQLPWDYEQLVINTLKPDDQLLDMGTGGGEFLLSIHHNPQLCSVTEGYEPNVRLCKQRLEPLGMTVRKIEDYHHIPYPDHSFDLILNRHEAYDINEVYRILKPQGTFITQQVGSKNDDDLIAKLDCEKEAVDIATADLHHAMKYAKATSLTIEAGYEAFTPIEFYDVGALIYFARIIEWEFKGFHVETKFKQLCALYKELQIKGSIRGTEHRYLMIAKKD